MQYLIGLFFGIGLYLIFADYFRVPYFATSKAHNNLAHRQEKKTSSLDVWLGDLAVWMARHIKLNDYKKMQLQTHSCRCYICCGICHVSGNVVYRNRI